MTAAQHPVDHTTALPESVIRRCADTDSAHGIDTGGGRDPWDYKPFDAQTGGRL